MANARRPARKLALVTGGAGFIGSHLVDELLRRGWRVRVLSPHVPGNLLGTVSRLRSDPQRRLELIKGDIRNPKTVRKSVSGVDAVFHLAGKVVVPLSFRYPESTRSINVGGTKNLLESCLEEGVYSFVFASSAFVPRGNAGSRSTVVSPYAQSKADAEKLILKSVGKGLPACVVRLWPVYGPRQKSGGMHVPVVPNFITRARAGRAITVFGSSHRDMVFVGDAVNALILASKRGKPGEVYEVASGSSVPLTAIAKEIARALRGRSTVRVKGLLSVSEFGKKADLALARRRLGFKPRVPLKTGLRKTIKSMVSRSD